MENPFGQDPFRDEDVEGARDQNPYTAMEGYELEDNAGLKVGEVEETVYDAVSDVLKYVVVDGRPIPAERIEVDVENERVRVPYPKDLIEAAPGLEDISGRFDRALHAHYEERG